MAFSTQASKRHAKGEITLEEFLNVAHQIKQVFQYQEQKQRSNSWESSCDDPLLSPKEKRDPRDPREPLGPNHPSAEELYQQHKSRLVRTRLLPHRQGKRTSNFFNGMNVFNVFNCYISLTEWESATLL